MQAVCCDENATASIRSSRMTEYRIMQVRPYSVSGSLSHEGSGGILVVFNLVNHPGLIAATDLRRISGDQQPILKAGFEAALPAHVAPV